MQFLSMAFEIHLDNLKKLQDDIATISIDKALAEFIALPQADLGDDDDEASLRSLLVTLMNLSLQCWEQSTQMSRLELAERSKFWSVYNNNGRLETRTLNRYLHITTLPKYPRWQTVLQTAYFVLGHAPEESPVKQKLQRTTDRVQQWLQRQALLKRR